MHSRTRALLLATLVLAAIVGVTQVAVGAPVLDPNPGRPGQVITTKYVGRAFVGAEPELIIVLRASGGTLYASIVGPHLSGIFSAQCPIGVGGAVSFAISGTGDHVPITYTFKGTVAAATASGRWSATNGHSGRWDADKLVGIANSGTWTMIAPTGAHTTYAWTSAFAVLVKAGGQNFVAVFFDGASTVYPVDALLTVSNTAALTIGNSVAINDLVLRLSLAPAGHYYAREAAPNTIIFSQLGLAAAGHLSAAMNVTEKQFDGTGELRLSQQSFANVVVARDYR